MTSTNDLFSVDLPADFLASMPELEGHPDQIVKELPPTFRVGGDARSLEKVLKLVEQYEQMKQTAGSFKWFDPEGEYPISVCTKHKAFFDAGLLYPERLFMAANRVGKSICGAFELACHLTGIYPDWWTGRRFEHKIEAWAVGPDARTVRDTAQKELIGPIGQFGTGMIPAHALGQFWGLQGTNQAIDIIMIKHVSGGWSRLGFKNYKQDPKAFMGTSLHAIWLDEECPLEIYNECNIRTATTGGIMLVTFTPLQGLSPMVVNFCKKADFLVGARPIVVVDTDDDLTEDGYDANDAQYAVGDHTRKAVVQAGWNDAPWLDTETKARLLEDTPEYLKKARSEGIPSMGAGSVFPVDLQQVLCEPFVIPDSWPRMYALDVGWNRTAVLWAAMDPNSDTIFIYDEHYQGQLLPEFHAIAIKSRGEWIRGVIDPAARGRGQSDGAKLMSLYKSFGLKLAPAKNERESGVQSIIQRLAVGKIRVFKTCVNFQKEYVLYRRKPNGEIIDENDHLMDAFRYIINNQTRMLSKAQGVTNLGARYAATRYDV